MWEAVRYGNVDYTEDQRALEALPVAVPQEMQSSLTDKETVKDAWDSIADSRIGSDRACRATLQSCVRSGNTGLSRRARTSTTSLRLSTLMQQLTRYADDDIDEERAVKFLRIVPKKYTQLALSIETLLDFSELMVKVTGCLKAVDHRE
jgi:hypothetical protein